MPVRTASACPLHFMYVALHVLVRTYHVGGAVQSIACLLAERTIMYMLRTGSTAVLYHSVQIHNFTPLEIAWE